jgi:hypothetical protein
VAEQQGQHFQTKVLLGALGDEFRRHLHGERLADDVDDNGLARSA